MRKMAKYQGRNESLNRLARFARCRTGTAAIEFALTVPLMLLVLFGAVELSLAIAADRRVVEIAGSTGDLVARADRTIDQSEVIDIMRIGGYLLNPSPVSPLRITISNVSSSPTNAADTKVVWRCEYVGDRRRRPAHVPTRNTSCRTPSSSASMTA